MKKHMQLTALLILVLFLTGCTTTQQTVEIGAWKENLHDTTVTQEYEYDIKNPVAGMGGSNTTEENTSENSSEKKGSIFDGIINALQQKGQSATDSIINSTVGNKFTVEKDTGLIKVKLIKVVDGDTIQVHYKGETYIRLIGINTPESVHPEEEKNTESGIEASNHTKEILSDAEYVWLEFDEDLIDDYDRTLAYVWLSNDTSDILNMLNALLLKQDYAETMIIEPNDAYASEFEKLANE